MAQKKKLAEQLEIHPGTARQGRVEAKKKAHASEDKAIKNGGIKDKLLKKAGKSAPPQISFPIVGSGASAGGLKALELFLANVPAESGMGFVIAQHLIQPDKDAYILHGLHLPINLFMPLVWQYHSGKSYGNPTY